MKIKNLTRSSRFTVTLENGMVIQASLVEKDGTRSLSLPGDIKFLNRSAQDEFRNACFEAIDGENGTSQPAARVTQERSQPELSPEATDILIIPPEPDVVLPQATMIIGAAEDKSPTVDVDALKLKIENIRQDPKHAFNSKSDDSAHQSAVEEVRSMYEQLAAVEGEEINQ